MVTEQINHDPAHTFMNTGTQISGRPSMGSWLLYGLGAETEDLPGFCVLTSAGGGQGQGSEKGESLISISGDGRIAQWPSFSSR